MNWHNYPAIEPYAGIDVFVINDNNSIDVGCMSRQGYWKSKDGGAMEDPILWAYVDIQEAVKNASE